MQWNLMKSAKKALCLTSLIAFIALVGGGLLLLGAFGGASFAVMSVVSLVGAFAFFFGLMLFMDFLDSLGL